MTPTIRSLPRNHRRNAVNIKDHENRLARCEAEYIQSLGLSTEDAARLRSLFQAERKTIREWDAAQKRERDKWEAAGWTGGPVVEEAVEAVGAMRRSILEEKHGDFDLHYEVYDAQGREVVLDRRFDLRGNAVPVPPPAYGFDSELAF